MYDIKQITNYDILNNGTITKTVRVGGDKGYDRTVTYKIISFALPGVIKLGYCCEPKAIQYPIFLRAISENAKEFQIGKSGMFEIQSEEWQDINNEEMEPQIMQVPIIEVLIPWKYNEEDENFLGYKFKLDYCFSNNIN